MGALVLIVFILVDFYLVSNLKKAEGLYIGKDTHIDLNMVYAAEIYKCTLFHNSASSYLLRALKSLVGVAVFISIRFW